MMMNIQNIAIATSFSAVLAATIVPVMSQTSIQMDNNSNYSNVSSISIVSNNDWGQEQIQETEISLNASDLKQPHILRITTLTSATKLTGQIKLDGKVIKTLRNNKTQINLSPHLTKGRHKIKISGRYTPANSSVKVEFTGPSTQVNQQTSGSGDMGQTLIIDVL